MFSRIKKNILLLTIVASVSFGFPLGLKAQSGDSLSLLPGEGCATQYFYDLELRRLYGDAAASSLACSQRGMCDDPVNRDANIPDGSSIFKIIRLYFHVMQNDDGSNPASNIEDVAEQVNILNADFAPYFMSFTYELRFINSTAFRNLNTNSEFNQMKNAYAIEPDKYLNVYVASVNVNGSVFSFGNFPWSGNALGVTGGIVMNQTQFYPFGSSTFTHEVGHNLGLYHTHNGVSEVTLCSSCYEPAQSAGRDVLGDRCSDTDPTPTNFSCSPPGGEDECSGQSWGTTHFHNYMSYAPQTCRDEFSPQQTGRMHCWTDDRLSTWIIHSVITTDNVFGGVPLTVNFGAESPHIVSEWKWYFGDGDSSLVQNPSHTFDSAGVYSISLNITAEDGNFSSEFSNLVYAMADTFQVADVVGGPSQSIRVDVSINNNGELYSVTIPFTWGGPLFLNFDSVSTVGLRTEYMTLANGGIFQMNNDFGNKRAIRALVPPSNQPIAPGNGPILSLYFKLPPFEISGTNPIDLISYGLTNPSIIVVPGVYLPAIDNGTVEMGCCVDKVGNVDGDASGLVDIADLTALIDHLFINFPPLDCVSEGNVDGDPDGLIDIADLTLLIDHLFINFPELPNCQ